MAEQSFRSYIICTSPRSGSTLLCNLLLSTGVAGNPASYFHRCSISAWLRSFELSPAASTPEHEVLQSIVDAAVIEGSLNTGVFGLRLQHHSFEFFMQKLNVLHPGLKTAKECIFTAFGRTAFIHLTRLNKVEQAVSYLKAEQSGLWHMNADGTELERAAPPQPLNYDPEKIAAHITEVENADLQWEQWSAKEMICPLRITYEALSLSPNNELKRVLDYLGLDSTAAKGIRPGIAKLADQTSQDWVRRFSSGKNP